MVISTREVNTRKEHRCFGCAIKYPKSTKMTIVNWKDGNELSSYYWCEICDSYWQKYMADEVEGIGEGDLISEEHYRNYKNQYLITKNDTK